MLENIIGILIIPAAALAAVTLGGRVLIEFER